MPLAGVAQLVGPMSHKPKCYQFNSWPGHMPGLQIQSLVRACMRQPLSVPLLYRCFSPSLSPSLPFFLKSKKKKEKEKAQKKERKEITLDTCRDSIIPHYLLSCI